MIRWIHFIEPHLVWFVIVAAGQTLPRYVSYRCLLAAFGVDARGNVALAAVLNMKRRSGSCSEK